MRVTYVLPWPELGGGNKVIFQHAQLLAASGWEITVIGDGPRPDWFDLTVPYVDYSAARPGLPMQDLVVATFWTTIPIAQELARGPVAHFCQGYEGDLVHLAAQLAEIERVYRTPIPTLTVTPHLSQMLAARFGRRSRVVQPPLDGCFRPRRWRWAPAARPWLAVPGIFEADVKAVRVGLEAALLLRQRGVDFRLLRFSVLPLSDAERGILEPERYLTGVRADVVAEALRACDLLLFPSLAAEGFGLPLLEAMASGVPAVASCIPATRHFAAEAVPLVPPGDSRALADAAETLLHSPREWRRRRRLGLRTASRFHSSRVLPELIAALRWAAGADAGAA